MPRRLEDVFLVIGTKTWWLFSQNAMMILLNLLRDMNWKKRDILAQLNTMKSLKRLCDQIKRDRNPSVIV